MNLKVQPNVMYISNLITHYRVSGITQLIDEAHNRNYTTVEADPTGYVQNVAIERHNMNMSYNIIIEIK